VARGKRRKCLPCKCRGPFQCKCAQMATLFHHPLYRWFYLPPTRFSFKTFSFFVCGTMLSEMWVQATFRVLAFAFDVCWNYLCPSFQVGGAINLCPIEAFKFISIPHSGRDSKRFLHSAGGSANLLPANKFYVIHSHFRNWKGRREGHSSWIKNLGYECKLVASCEIYVSGIFRPNL